MNADELIDRARKAGFTFHIDGEEMHCRMSKSVDFRTREMAAEIRQRKDEIIETLKLEADRAFPGRSEKKTLACDLDAGKIAAVEIASTVLQANIWLAFDDGFDPGDGAAVFYGHELKFLRGKSAAELRKIHEVKLAFGAGSKVRQ